MVYHDHGITSLPLPDTHITHLIPTTPLINGLAQLRRFPKPIKQCSPLYLPVRLGSSLANAVIDMKRSNVFLSSLNPVVIL